MNPQTTPDMLPPSPSRAVDRPGIETARARGLHHVAAELASDPAMQAVRDELIATMQAMPPFETPDGRRTMHQAADEMILDFITTAMTMDVANPELLWWQAPEFVLDGQRIPGARMGLDNPDNVYLIASLDPEGHYVIRGRRTGSGPAQFTVVIMPKYLMNVANPAVLGRQIAELIEPTTGISGEYEITISPEPPGADDANHITNGPEGRFMIVRQTLADWSTDTVDQLTIHRTDGIIAESPTRAEYLSESVALVKQASNYWLEHWTMRQLYSGDANTVSFLRPRPGGWGAISGGNFALYDGEALAITVDTLNADYISLQCGDPWAMVSCSYIDRNGSLNSAQLKPNQDGTITYVIAKEDPGHYNWLDSEGLDVGTFIMRWQGVASEFKASDDTPILSMDVVPLEQLRNALDRDDTLFMSPEQRTEQAQKRDSDWRQRLLLPGR